MDQKYLTEEEIKRERILNKIRDDLQRTIYEDYLMTSISTDDYEVLRHAAQHLIMAVRRNNRDWEIQRRVKFVHFRKYPVISRIQTWNVDLVRPHRKGGSKNA
jgi:hypothetical protein